MRQGCFWEKFISLPQVLTVLWMSIGLVTPYSLFGQNFFAADKLALNTPPSKTASIKILSDYLCAGQPDETHKIRALYAWVTLNIAYLDSSNEGELWATPEHVMRQAPEKVLQNRTAVCQGFANLFCALVTTAGLPCEVVTGLVKNANGAVEQVGHAWAAARVDGEWRLFDPTWGVPPPGISRWTVVDQYFMANPETFIFQHLPDDPVWQLLENPVSERQFREFSESDILAFLTQESTGEFKFKDTLIAWYSMDPVTRILASEGRILSFNGSNERVVYGLGQNYWGLFLELRGLLDSLTDEAILADTLELDTVWFASQITLMEQYHARARVLFGQLESPERIEKSAKFYSPEDVAALLQKIKGDMRTGIFEHLLHQMPEEVLTREQIAQLRYQASLAEQSFSFADQELDCVKMASSCFEVSHNRSLLAIQLAQRQVRFAQSLVDDNSSAKNLKTITLYLDEAGSYYLQAIADCEQMRRRTPKFEFVEERRVTARQGLLSVRSCELRAGRTALSPEAEAVLSAQKLPIKRAERLVEKMSRIAQSINDLMDTLKILAPDLGNEFVAIGLFNQQLENFALQFNLANLYFRLTLNEYEIARSANTLVNQRAQIRKGGNRGIRALTEASTSLDYLEDSGRLPASSISQKKLQINKLSKNLNAFLKDL